MPDGSNGMRQPQSKATSTRRRRPSVGLMALEPRLMYDGAGVATAAAAAHHHNDHHADGGSGSAAQNGSSSATNTGHHEHGQSEHGAPAVTTSTPSTTFVGGGSAATLDSGLTLSGGDRDGNLATATVSISSGFTSGDTLNFTNQNGITGSYNSSTGVLTLSGRSSVANYQTALESITYSSTATDPSNGGIDGSRTISWVASDGSHHNGTSSTATSTVSVFAPPQLTAGTTRTYTSGDAAVTLDSGLTLTDPSRTLASATVAVTSGFLLGDTLSFTNQNGISGSYDSSTGVLTLSGTASVANYQAALASVTFGSSASDSTHGGANLERTIVWTTNDGANLATATSNVAVAAGMLPGSRQIVFIDGNVPDAQALAAGVQPGITAVILDPNANGVQEIADYLAENNVHNLDAIQIVSHGEDATVRLGNTIFGLPDVSMFSGQLATWGQALKPGGDILFYGCNVGESTAGMLFEIEVSQATGGAHVAASSGLVGAASLGGSWTLDVADGTIAVGNPFTATALARYDNVLTNQIWFTESVLGTTVDDQVGHVNSDGSNLTNVFNATSTGASGTYLFQGIALDTADGVYFAVNTNGSAANTIVRGSISGGAPVVIATALGVNDTITYLTYSAATGKVYYSEINSPANAGTNSGIYTITNPTGASPTVTKLISASTNNLVEPGAIAIDAQDNLLFWNDFSSFGATGTVHSQLARLEVANLTTGAILNNALQTSVTNGAGASPLKLYWDIDIDPATNTLYWIINDRTVGQNNQIFSATYSTGATPTLSNVTTLYTAPGGTGAPTLIGTAITVDPASGVYYAAFGSPTTSGEIVQGSLSGGNPANPTALFTLPVPTTPAGLTGAANDVEVEIAPVLSVTGSPSVIPGGSAVDLSSSLTLVDTTQNIASASVQITTGLLTGDTLAATTTGTNITASYTAGTGKLTLTGVDTAAHYQSVLDSVTFATTATTGTSRTITWSASDGNLASNSVSTSATIHLAPTVTPGAGGTYTGGGSAALISASLSLTSPSTSTLATATISIDSTHFLIGDTLSFTNTNSTTEGNIAVQSYNSATGVLTLTSNGNTATLSQWTVALKAVTYSFGGGGDPAATKNGSPDTSRILSYTINDGTVSSTAATNTLTIVHAAPTIGGTSGVNPTFAGGGSPLALDGGLTVADADSLNLASAKVTISGNFQSTVDVLTINGLTSGTTGTNGNSITFSYASGVMTLTGQDTVAAYQAALRLVSYGTATNADPTTGGTSKTITWSVTDTNADNTKNTTTSTTLLTTAHTAPSLTIAGSPSYSAGGSAVVLLSSATLSDPDSGGNLTGATVSITGGLLSGDTLNFSTQNGISVSSYTNGVLTLTGSSSLANYVTALKSVTFSSSAGDPTNGGADTSRTITWQVKDSNNGLPSSLSNTGTVTLTVSAPPPSLTGVGGSVSYFASGSPVTVDGSVGITDLASTTLSSATVSITGNFLLGDTLAADTSGTSITARYDKVHGVLLLSGSDTLAHYQTVLDRITYSSTAFDPTAGASANSRTISWQVNDGRATNNLSSIVTTSVDVTHIAPVEAAGGSVSWTPGNGAVVVDSTVTVTDGDINHSITTATVTISSGKVTGDTLGFNGGTNTQSFGDGSTITGSYNGTTGVLTLTAGAGNPTAADFQLALQSVSFNNTSNNVSASNPGGTRTLDWTVNTSVASSVTTHSTVVPPATAPGDFSSFAPGTTVPPNNGTSGFLLPPSGTSGSGTSGIGTLVSGTSGLVTLGTNTSGSGMPSWSTSGAGTFDPTLFGSGAGGPAYFDPGGGFGSGLDFGSTFTTASNDAPADAAAPLTLFADNALGFDQKTDSTTDKSVNDATPDKPIVVAEKDMATPDPVRAVERLVPADTAPVPGKVGLSAQLRAAGRHGLLHNRLALLKSLHSVRG